MQVTHELLFVTDFICKLGHFSEPQEQNSGNIVVKILHCIQSQYVSYHYQLTYFQYPVDYDDNTKLKCQNISYIMKCKPALTVSSFYRNTLIHITNV